MRTNAAGVTHTLFSHTSFALAAAPNQFAVCMHKVTLDVVTAGGPFPTSKDCLHIGGSRGSILTNRNIYANPRNTIEENQAMPVLRVLINKPIPVLCTLIKDYTMNSMSLSHQCVCRYAKAITSESRAAL